MKFIKLLLFFTGLVILLLALSACKGKSEPSGLVDVISSDHVESGPYPQSTGDSSMLALPDEGLIYPGLDEDTRSLDNQEIGSYPSVTSGNESTYPGVMDEGVYPYPASDIGGNDEYPEPEANLDDSSQNLPDVEQTTATPTNTLAPLATAEPSPTSTPELIFTPTPTQTPTPSPTAVPTATPLPLYVDRSLRASDPRLFRQASGKVQLVDFFAFWDATSKALAPFVNQLKSEYGNDVNFIFLDIDDPANQNWKKNLGYKIQPHLFLLDSKGNILLDWSGFVDEAEIRAELKKALGK